jgi:hypothetical protein
MKYRLTFNAFGSGIYPPSLCPPSNSERSNLWCRNAHRAAKFSGLNGQNYTCIISIWHSLVNGDISLQAYKFISFILNVFRHRSIIKQRTNSFEGERIINIQWPKSQLSQTALKNADANTELCQSICRTVSQRCELCTEHEESHFEQFL